METHEAGGIGFASGGWPLDPARSTLIFNHGSGGSHALWDGQISALARRANTVAPDLPGRFAGGILIGTGARLRVLPAILERIEKDYPAHLAPAEKPDEVNRAIVDFLGTAGL